MKYKLLAIDIDDTLVRKAQPVSEENIRAIHAAENAGVYVTLATGRGFLASSHVWKQLGMSRRIINYGGAMIYDVATEAPVMTTELESDTVIAILELAERMGLHAHLYQGDEIIYEKESVYPTVYSKVLGLPARIEPNIRRMEWHNVPKALIMTDAERVPELLRYFTKEFEGRAEVSASSPGFIEFNKIGANKGSALKLLADSLHIEQAQTSAIGDNTLDIEMIRWAGLGACVADGHERVKSVADVITPICEQNAVAWLIYNYILKDE